MIEYKCEKCKKIFNHKHNYIRHLNKKNVCTNFNNCVCAKCGKVYKHSSSLVRHKKNCKGKKKKCNNVQTVVNNNQTIVNNITNINITNNFKLVKFGEENINILTDEIYEKIINKGFKSLTEYIENVHFNKEYPEYHNIYVANLRDEFVLIYTGEAWEIRNEEDIIDKYINYKIDHIENKFDELIEKLPQKAIKKFQKFLEEKDDDKTINQMKRDLKLLLYNKRYLPINLQKRLKNESNFVEIKYRLEDLKDTFDNINIQNMKLEDKNEINKILQSIKIDNLNSTDLDK